MTDEELILLMENRVHVIKQKLKRLSYVDRLREPDEYLELYAGLVADTALAAQIVVSRQLEIIMEFKP